VTYPIHKEPCYFTAVSDRTPWMHPGLRIIWAMCFIAPVLVIDKLFKKLVMSHLDGGLLIGLKYAEAVLFFALFLVMYRQYARLIEKRQPFELTYQGALQEFVKGSAIGGGMVAFIVGLLIMSGCYQVISCTDKFRIVVDYFVKFTMGAFFEEILFRLIIFRLTEEWLGSVWAIVIQSMLFGLAHLANENATLFTSLTIMIVGGITYTAAFIYTHRAWLAVGIHMGWNYFQSGIFGMPNSGSAYKGVFLPQISGPEWLTGGAFGIEASIPAVSLNLLVGIVLLYLAAQRGHFLTR